MIDIYLDQNHWIELAKARLGQRSEVSKDLADLAFDAVAQAEVRFPISAVHLIEYMKIKSPQRRSDLARLFIAYSQGWVLPPWEDILSRELESFLEGRSDPLSLSLRRGPYSAFATPEVFAGFMGVSPEEFAELNEDSPKAWGLFLNPHFEIGRDSARMQLQAISKAYASRVEEVRGVWRAASPTQRYLYFAEGVLEDVAGARSLSLRGRHAIDVIASMEPSAKLSALGKIPSLDVLIRLGAEKTKQWDQVTNKNDLFDIGFLAVSIPYCDIVVTERHWAQLAARTGLEDKYQTRVLAKFASLESTLKEFSANPDKASNTAAQPDGYAAG